MNNEIKFILVDVDTGEIVKEIHNQDTFRVRTLEQKKYYKEHQEEINLDRLSQFGQDTNFLKVSTTALNELSKEKLTALDMNICFILMAHTNYTSGLIAHDNNKPLTREWLYKNVKAHEKRIDDSLRKLIKKGIICKGTTADIRYFFNPYIGYRGRYINATLCSMFKASKWYKAIQDKRK